MLQLKIKFLWLAMLLGTSLFIVSCSNENEEDLFGDANCEKTENISLQEDIIPVLSNNCYGCHGNGEASGGIVLDNYEDLMTVALNGRLSGAVNHKSGYSSMPPSGQKLAECDLLAIDKWIEEGALNN